jgi:hypothetical protein
MCDRTRYFATFRPLRVCTDVDAKLVLHHNQRQMSDTQEGKEEILIPIDIDSTRLNCDASLAGHSFPIKLTNWQGLARFPEAIKDESDSIILTDQRLNDQVGSVVELGRPSHWSNIELHSFEPSHLIFEPKIDNFALLQLDEARPLHQELNEWMILVLDWVKHLNPGAIQRLPILQEKVARISDFYTSGHRQLIAGAHQYVIASSIPTQLYSFQWDEAIARANANETLPLAYQFLNSAEEALHANNPRAAILDCGTAAELAFNESLRMLLESFDPKVKSFVSKRSKLVGLGSLLGTLTDLESTDALPRKLNKDLIDPRNKVVHHGKEVSIEEAQTAFMKTQELLIATITIPPVSID